jgi:hypothetical protein
MIMAAEVTATSDDATLVAAFEAGTAPPEGFHHANHVRVAWMYLGRLPLLAAAERFVAGLKGFAAAHGKPQLYHETITLAFLLLIHDRIVTRGRGRNWREFADANPDLLTWKPSTLDRYYSPDLIGSDLARRAFVWPDRMTDGEGR